MVRHTGAQVVVGVAAVETGEGVVIVMRGDTSF